VGHSRQPDLEGLASGDFEPVFRALVGETAALSPSSILKLKADWQQEYAAWKKRPLRGCYVYLYADGLYLKAGSEQGQDRAAGHGAGLPREHRIVG
jgi:transposase-like protein